MAEPEAQQSSAYESLSPKRRRFVDEYLVDLNATQAAIRAGYSQKTARSQGQRLLTNVDVAAAISEGRNRLSERTQVTQEMVIEELRRIAFLDIRSLFTWDEERACYVASRELTEAEAAAVSGVKAKTTSYTTDDGVTETRIELELKTYDKLRALENLGKYLGMFTERVDVTSGGQPITRIEIIPSVRDDNDA